MRDHLTLCAFQSPCFDCEKREPGCHGSCEAYQTYSAECEAVRGKRVTYNMKMKRTPNWACKPKR